MAALRGHAEVVNVLIEYSATVDIGDKVLYW